jgi:hypothetical protein
MNIFTKYDLVFLIELLLGILADVYILHLGWTVWLILILIGLTFEIVTSSSWSYSPEFKKSFLVIAGTDISLGAAISWAGVLVVCMAFGCATAHFFPFPHSREIFTLLAVGVVGNLLETICVTWGMFVYENTLITRSAVFKTPRYLWRVPISVRLGYFFLFGSLCAGIVFLFTV